MKKICSVILVVAIFCSLLTVNVFAQTATIRSESGTYSYNYEQNKEFDVTFLIENNPGVVTSTFRVKYDPKVIQAIPYDDESTDGYLSYKISGYDVRYISTDTINEALNQVPSSDPKFDLTGGYGNGTSTAAELGVFKIVSISGGMSVSGSFQVLEEDAKFMTIRFKMIAPGETTIDIIGGNSDSTKNIITGISENDFPSIPVNIEPAKVIIKAEEITTEATTEETTKATTERITEATTKSTIEKENSNNKIDITTQATTNVEETTVIETQTQSTSEKVTFSDINQYPWAINAIENLATKKIVNGIGNGMFNPSANVKRADFIIMLLNALNLDTQFDDNFSDVSKDKYYYNALGKAKALGIANGLGNNVYNPEGYISRQDMMVLAKRAMELKEKLEKGNIDVLERFADCDLISAYAEESLATMVNAGIVNGTGNKIEPRNYTTRVQAAVIIYNICEKIRK